MDIFERASRSKLRFPTEKGELSTEQLWELPLTSAKLSLDSIAKGISRELRAEVEESFVSTVVNTNQALLTLRLDIVKHVIAANLAKIAANEARVATNAYKQKLRDALAIKDGEAILEKSREEILAELGE